jgi:hypothetical protein
MTAGMKRFLYSFLVAVALAQAPLIAQAQTSTTSTSTAIQSGLVVEKDRQQLKNAQAIYGTVEDCEQNAQFKFEVTYTAPVNFVEAWLGVGSQDCKDKNSRIKASATATEPACKFLGIDSNPSTKKSIEVSARQLFSKDWDATDCSEERNVLYTLYFIPLNQETVIDSSMAFDPITVGTYSTLTATFTLFTLRPDAPSGSITPRSGESEIGITFKTLTGALAKTKYRAYFDWGTADGQECGSGALVAGEPPPEEEDTIASVTTTSSTAKLKGLDDKDIPLDSYVAAAVVTVDPAGNESPLSEIVCVQREETIGFADQCAMDPDCKLHSCALRPAGNGSGSSWGLSSLLALACVLLIRRRHV